MFYTDRKSRFLWAYALRSLAIVLFIGILVRLFLLSAFVMDSDGMKPNLISGDFVLALKKSHLSRGQTLIYSCSEKGTCAGRILGLPGDRVEFLSGKLILNGDPAEYTPLGDGLTMKESWHGLSHAVMVGPSDVPALVVPPNNYFVINDNRSKFGISGSMVDLNNVEGRVWRIWLSLDWHATDGSILPWPKIRWRRILQSID